MAGTKSSGTTFSRIAREPRLSDKVADLLLGTIIADGSIRELGCRRSASSPSPAAVPA